MTNSYFPKVKG